MIEEIKDVDLRRLLEEEKRARLDNDTTKSTVLIKEIVRLNLTA
jgi:hypothetical protein